MPTIDMIDGIKNKIYYGEHRPPHIHAIYNEFDIAIEIENSKIINGYLPGPKFKRVHQWINKNRKSAIDLFYVLNPYLR